MANDLSDAEFSSVEQCRPKLIHVVTDAITDYINDDALCSADGLSFPDRSKLTGEYYLEDENYSSDSFTIAIRLTVRCLEKPHRFSERADDYLGFFIGLTLSRATAELDLHTLDSAAL
ncbi:MAG: hypothetical protein H8F28_23445 [Fibrella sp.]|nr:hypothetical protein [Armatimonadota bacterium]